MTDWSNVRMTLLEVVMSLIVVFVAAVMLGALMIEAGTGMPARTAIQQCGWRAVLEVQCQKH